MAKPVLPTDYKDDVLNPSMNGKRKYNKVQNPDGTFSLEDVTQYDQIGSTFGAKQLNDMNEAFNDLPELKVANNDTTTEPGFVADARVVKTHGDEIDELKTLNFKDAGGDSTSQLELKQAVIYICENFVPLGKSGRGRFQCESGWFDYDIIHAVGDYFSGIINGHTVSVTYAFHKMGRGADAVLKKLGRSGTIAGVGGYWMDPPAGQYKEWTTGCVRWNGDDLVVTVEDDYAQGHLNVGAKVGSKSRPGQWGDKTGGLITLKY